MRLKLNHILIAATLLLLTTNFTTVVTFRNHLKEDEKNEEKQIEIEIPNSQIGRFFRTELNLNSDQQESFREFRRKYNRSANGVLTDMSTLRSKMVDELRNVEPSRDVLDRLAGELGDLHKELKGLTFDYYFDMQSVLNDDQQERMVDIFQVMLTEQGYAKTPSHGHSGNHDENGECDENDHQQEIRQGRGQGNGGGYGRNRNVDPGTFEGVSESDEFDEFEEIEE